MDLEAELNKLAGQRVYLYQWHTTPPALSGRLVANGNGRYEVEDEDGLGWTSFDWSQVERLSGHIITLEDPAGLNESPPDDNTEPYQPGEFSDDELRYDDPLRRGDDEWEPFEIPAPPNEEESAGHPLPSKP